MRRVATSKGRNSPVNFKLFLMSELCMKEARKLAFIAYREQLSVHNIVVDHSMFSLTSFTDWAQTLKRVLH